MGYKQRNKQAPPAAIPGSDTFRDPKNARSLKKKRKADEAAGDFVFAAGAVGGVSVKKSRVGGNAAGKGKSKGKGREEEFSDADEEVLKAGWVDVA